MAATVIKVKRAASLGTPQDSVRRVAQFLYATDQPALALELELALEDLEAAHDRRVTQLLEANNREVERRRAALRVLAP